MCRFMEIAYFKLPVRSPHKKAFCRVTGMICLLPWITRYIAPFCGTCAVHVAWRTQNDNIYISRHVTTQVRCISLDNIWNRICAWISQCQAGGNLHQACRVEGYRLCVDYQPLQQPSRLSDSRHDRGEHRHDQDGTGYHEYVHRHPGGHCILYGYLKRDLRRTCRPRYWAR